MAARVAETASSMRCFFSFSSTSVAAPTLMTQTPPASLASRSCSFSRSQSESVRSISARIWRRGLDALGGAAALDDRRGVLRDDDAPRRTEDLEPDLVELQATSGEMTSAPVSTAMSCSMALRRSPKPAGRQLMAERNARLSLECLALVSGLSFLAIR